VKRAAFIVVIAIVLSAVGCDDSINPIAAFEPKLVVYSVLSSESDTQYVRVHSSYVPPENNPQMNADEHSLTDATVTISDGANTYTFQFAEIERTEGSRYGETIGLYYAYPFRPKPNQEYTLSVSSPSAGQASSTTVVPGAGTIDYFSLGNLYYPADPPYFTQPILPQFSLNDAAKAQLVRFYIVYTTENPGEVGKEKYYEVPQYWRIVSKNLEIHDRRFPVPTRRTAPLTRRGETFKLSATYPFPTYNESIYGIRQPNFNVRFKRAVFQLIQFDEAWYKYYASANLFQDRLSVRVDPPDYSNIQGGWGMFGSIRVDSIVVPLPDFIMPYPERYGR